MIISNKIVKYLHTVIHQTFFNPNYNTDAKKQEVQQNIFNILKRNKNYELITTICTIEFDKILQYEVKYYFKTKHSGIEKTTNYVDILFDHFLDLYKKSISLTNLFNEIYNFSKGEFIIEDYKITNLFIKYWDSIVFTSMFPTILDQTKHYLYSPKLHSTLDLENVFYTIHSKFKHRFSHLVKEIKVYGINQYKLTQNPQKDTLQSYLTTYLDFTEKETKLELDYTFYNYIDVKDELTLLFFKTNLNYLTDLYSKGLEEMKLEELHVIDDYLYKFTDDYNGFVSKTIHSLKTTNPNPEILTHYIQVYNSLLTIYGSNTYRFSTIIEPCLQETFLEIQTIPNLEVRLVNLIIEDIKHKKVSEYIKLLLFVDKSKFVSNYMNYLCRRIINKKCDLKVELEYSAILKKLNMDVYRIELILQDVILNKAFNKELFFCKTKLLVGRYMVWPLKKKEEILPNAFKPDANLINHWYTKKFPSRKLHFLPNLLRCDITFGDYTFNVKGIYSDVLLLFNNSNSINQTRVTCNLAPFITLNLIIQKNNQYHINDDFYSEKKYIKLN
tara:strand:- start:1761 stop:3428 length:1668 start_codon:yes stop_codon:yes gene_type:complete